MEVYVLEDAVIFCRGKSAIAYDRATQSFGAGDYAGNQEVAPIECSCIIGFIPLIFGSYAVCVDSQGVGGIPNRGAVQRIISCSLVFLDHPSVYLNAATHDVNAEEIYVSLVEQLIGDHSFYYSEHTDLCDGDDQFCWNAHLVPAGAPRCPRLIRGAFTCFQHAPEQLQFALLSRRSRKRAGTRYVRGIDNQGHVANFVVSSETIQYVFKEGQLLERFVQIRGSIPLFWEQGAGYGGFRPVISVQANSEQQEATDTHFGNLKEKYGEPILCVSLVNKHGNEETLGTSYGEAISRSRHSDSIQYVAWDFHHHCAKGHFEKTSELLSDIEESVLDAAIIRTNCVDCLDRTNVFQSDLGKMFLLRELGQKQLEEPVLSLFKNAWADNGDSISMQYAGTGAMKSDFTRTGKRSLSGMVDDGLKSLKRYRNAKHSDRYRQAALELFLGLSKASTSALGQLNDQAVETSVNHILSSHSGERCKFASQVVSVNKRKKRQPRVILITGSAYYRLKMNVKQTEVVRSTRVTLLSIETIVHGTLLVGGYYVRVNTSDYSDVYISEESEGAICLEIVNLLQKLRADLRDSEIAGGDERAASNLVVLRQDDFQLQGKI